MGFPGGSQVKASACNVETGVRSLGQEVPLEKEINPLQYSCLENIDIYKSNHASWMFNVRFR